MHTKELIERTQNYIILSNQHNLALIKVLFADDAIYRSDFFGEYKGSAAIHVMMLSFFTRFPDAHWKVGEYRSIEGDGVEFTFMMTGKDAASGKSVQRRGLERIYFNSDGLIKHIAVYKPEGDG